MNIQEQDPGIVGTTLRDLAFNHWSNNFREYELCDSFVHVSNSVALSIFSYIWTNGNSFVDLTEFEPYFKTYSSEEYTVSLFIPTDKFKSVEAAFYNNEWCIYTNDINSENYRFITFEKAEDMVEESKTSKQIGGNHYQMAIQPIEYITKNNLGYMEGNVVKYVSRHRNKNGVEDIDKAIHYLEMIKEFYYGIN
jgi:hypothetical protein